MHIKLQTRYTILLATFSLVAIVSMFVNRPSRVLAAACQAPSVSHGSVTQTVTVPSTNTYRVWSRMAAADTTNNTYLLEISGGGVSNCYTVGGSSVPVYSASSATRFNSDSSNWISTDKTTGNHIDVNLSAGTTYTIKMIGNATNVVLDRLIFAADTSCVPTGTGDNCANPPPPTTVNVTITAPTTATVGGTAVTVAANASATPPATITGISIVAQGSGSPNTIGSCTSSPCSLNWDSTTVQNGTYTLVVTATATGGFTGSASQSVLVNNGGGPGCNSSPTTPVISSTHNTTTTSIESSWTASDPGVNCTLKDYLVFRDGNKVGSTAITGFTDSGLKPNTTYTYTVQAEDTSGTVSPMSAPVTAKTNAIDNAITLVSPQDGSKVKGDVKLQVKINANYIDHVNYVIDRKFFNQQTVSPFSTVWHTTKKDNGQHLIVVNAFNKADEPVGSSQVTVTVHNTFCLSTWLGLGSICF